MKADTQNLLHKFYYMDYDKELNISEKNIEQIIKSALIETNTDSYGREAIEYIDYICEVFSSKYNMPKEALIELSNYCCDVAQMAGAHSFNKGFKEGIRLFRTLMHL